MSEIGSWESKVNDGNGGFVKLSHYRLLFPAAILATLLGWGLEQFVEGEPERFDTLLLLGAAAWLTLMGALFWRKPDARRTLEFVLCVGSGALFAIRLIYAAYFMEPSESFRGELAEIGYWLAPFLGAQFLWFGVGTGRTTAIAFLTLLGLVPIPAIAYGQLPIGATHAVSTLLLAGAASIFIFHILGKALIRYGAEKRVAEHLAVTDHLTGIANRRGLNDKLTEEHARTQRYGGRFSILMLDLDRFKQINDQHGHQAGDQILRELATLLQEECREADTVGRWGGEEFMAILPQIGVHDATEAASRIRKAIANHEFHDALDVTVSIGVAEHQVREPIERLVARADEALYQAKRTGRDRVKAAH